MIIAKHSTNAPNVNTLSYVEAGNKLTHTCVQNLRRLPSTAAVASSDNSRLTLEYSAHSLKPANTGSSHSLIIFPPTTLTPDRSDPHNITPPSHHWNTERTRGSALDAQQKRRQNYARKSYQRSERWWFQVLAEHTRH